MDLRWHHSPVHFFQPGCSYIVTGGTVDKAALFCDTARLQLLEDLLLQIVSDCGWLIAAWAVFVNHYHLIAQSLAESATLSHLLNRLHSQTARELNRMDDAAGRQVWFQFWDDELTFERSYYARLNYVHNNAVKHGLVAVADQYPFCSARWFREKADPAFYRKVCSFKWDQVRIKDDF
ncbi:MAG: hypothetical protein EHM23_36055 [Acidobacteria bacterium]|nr:MAG: hypothetical protein EHM23_36055 [Acidobacteriota bacterium]